MLRVVALTSLTALSLGLAISELRGQVTPTPGFMDEMDGFRLIRDEPAVRGVSSPDRMEGLAETQDANE